MNSGCDTIRDLIADAVTGTLPAEQAKSLDEHLRGCPDCRNYAEALRQEDRLLGQLVAGVAADMPDRRKQLVQVLSHHQSERTSHPAGWRTIMKSPIAKLAVAAVVVIAGGIGLSLWRTTGSGIALADVLARLDEIKVFKCTGTMTVTGQESSGKSYRSETRHTRLASPDHGVIITERVDPNGRRTLLGEAYVYPQKKGFILIQHTDKTYTRKELRDADLKWIQKMFNRYNDPGTFLKEVMSCKHTSLGRSTVDGVEVEGFGTTDPNYQGTASRVKDPRVDQVDAKVWIDVQRQLPVRYESLTRRLDALGNPTSSHFVMHDFQWDVPVTAAGLEPPPVPDGYVVVVDNLPGPLTEEGVIQGLRQCVEWLGRYPRNISVPPPRGIQSELAQSDSPGAVRMKEELKGLTEQDRVNRLMDAGTPMRRVQRFFIALNDGKKDPAYYGKTVTSKDADKVLMRWKVSDNEYRVIFGDLHAETVSPERLAELEKALSK